MSGWHRLVALGMLLNVCSALVRLRSPRRSRRAWGLLSKGRFEWRVIASLFAIMFRQAFESGPRSEDAWFCHSLVLEVVAVAFTRLRNSWCAHEAAQGGSITALRSSPRC